MPSYISQVTTKIRTYVDSAVAGIDLSSYAPLAGAMFTGAVNVPELDITGANGLDITDATGGINLSGGSISLTSSGGINLADGSIYVSGSGSIDLSAGTGYIYAGDIDLSTRDGSITFGTNGGISMSDGTVSISGSGYIDVSGTSQSLFGDGGISVGSGRVTLSNNGGVDLSGGSGALLVGSGGIDISSTGVLTVGSGGIDLSGSTGGVTIGTGALTLGGGGITDSSQITIGSSGIDVTGNSQFQNNLTVSGDLTVSGTTTTVNSSTTEITDVVIELAKDADQASNATTDAGIHMTRGSTEDGIFMGWDEGDDAIVFKSHQDGGGVTDVSMATGVANVNVAIDASNLLVDGTDALGPLSDVDAALA